MLIAQITDLHVRPAGRTANRFVETNRMLEAAVASLLRLDPGPDVVLATGDLTDCGLPEEYAELRRILAPLPMPVHLIPGNHDRRGNLVAAFPDHPYLPRDGGFLHYVVEDYPVRLIGLDTVLVGHGHGVFCAERQTWLRARLEEAPDWPTLLFMHHPPFMTGLAQMDTIACQDGEAVARIVRDFPAIERVICGHHHRPIQLRWAGTVGSVAPSTAHQVMFDMLNPVASMITMEPPGFHLHLWRADVGLVTHMAYVETFPGPFPFVSEPEYLAGGD